MSKPRINGQETHEDLARIAMPFHNFTCLLMLGLTFQRPRENSRILPLVLTQFVRSDHMVVGCSVVPREHRGLVVRRLCVRGSPRSSRFPAVGQRPERAVECLTLRRDGHCSRLRSRTMRPTAISTKISDCSQQAAGSQSALR